MSRLTDLIAQAKAKDPQLGADLESEFRVLSERRPFGLNFERHQPEAVELPSRPVRKGDKVRILPPRGTPAKGDPTLWRVTGFDGNGEGRTARLAALDPQGPDDATERFEPVDDLVVVAEFRDPIYPGLVSTGRVERGGPDKPFHTVINAENYHALQTLLFTHRGKVDCIYIDPPYNTGAKDWKYNNDYVDGEDLYRHSKWLAFMERRLLLARELLNPDASVLIVTIDEREMHRLGVLLQQLFPEAKTQMVTITINHRGVARLREFTRVEEYAFFVFLGDAGPALTGDDLLTVARDEQSTATEDVRWERLIKGSNNARRVDRPNLFYPVWVDRQSGAIAEIGEPLPLGLEPSSVPARDGLAPMWPLSRDGSEKRWQNSHTTLRRLLQAGYVRTGSYDRKNDRWSIQYLNRGQIDRIGRGEIAILGKDEHGVVILQQMARPARSAMTVWNRPQHAAGYYGSGVLSSLIPGRKFPFPKSLYAVEDCVRFAVKDNKHAVVLDFFAGSGTTAHAVARLNRQDGGARSSISVTNNEVSGEEAQALRLKGLRPGDAEWESLGICEHFTKPRVRAAITGQTPAGTPVKGEYKFTDESAMSDGLDENVEFFDLTYQTPWRVARHRAFDAVAPLLWLRAGARGRRIDAIPEQGWDVADVYGILVNLDRAKAFAREVASSDSVGVVFVVTDDDRRFQMVCGELPDTVEVVRLYESYLRNFEINTGRE